MKPRGNIAIPKWTVLGVRYNLLKYPCFAVSNLMINEKEFLIFGLKDNNKATIRECAIFDRVRGMMEPCEFSLPKAVDLSRRFYTKYEGRHYFVSNKALLYIFDGVRWEESKLAKSMS